MTEMPRFVDGLDTSKYTAKMMTSQDGSEERVPVTLSVHSLNLSGIVVAVAENGDVESAQATPGWSLGMVLGASYPALPKPGETETETQLFLMADEPRTLLAQMLTEALEALLRQENCTKAYDYIMELLREQNAMENEHPGDLDYAPVLVKAVRSSGVNSTLDD